MKRPCPSWQLTRLPVPLPPRRPLQAMSRAIPAQALPEQESVDHQFKVRVQELTELNVETVPPLTPSSQSPAEEIFERITKDYPFHHRGPLVPLPLQNSSHLRVARELLPWLTKKWQETPYASLISIYTQKHLEGPPRCLLATDPTVFLVRNILHAAAKNSHPQRLSGRSAQIIGSLCAKGHSLSPAALRDICDATQPLTLPPIRRHLITLLRRLLGYQSQGAHSEPSQDTAPDFIPRICRRLIEIASLSGDHATVAHVFAQMCANDIPFADANSIRQVLRSEFARFKAQSRAPPLAGEVNSWLEIQAESLDRLFENVHLILHRTLDQRTRADMRLRVILSRGFFDVVQFAVQHRELKLHASNALYVLRLLRKTAKQDDGAKGSDGLAMFELAWADSLMQFRAKHGPDARIDLGIEFPTESPADRQKENTYWSYREGIRTVLERLWASIPASPPPTISDPGQIARQRRPGYFGPQFSVVQVNAHRHAILLRHALLSNQPRQGLEHFRALQHVTSQFISSYNSSTTPDARERSLFESTIADLRKRVHGSYLHLLNSAITSIEGEIFPRPNDLRRASNGNKTSAHFEFLLDVLRVRSLDEPLGVQARREEDHELTTKVWKTTLAFLRRALTRIPWEALARGGDSSMERVRNFGMRPVFELLNAELEGSLALQPRHPIRARLHKGKAETRSQSSQLHQVVRSQLLKDDFHVELQRSCVRWAQASTALSTSSFKAKLTADGVAEGTTEDSLGVLTQTFTLAGIESQLPSGARIVGQHSDTLDEQ